MYIFVDTFVDETKEDVFFLVDFSLLKGYIGMPLGFPKENSLNNILILSETTASYHDELITIEISFDYL